MFSRMVEEATRTSSGMRGMAAGVEVLLFDATQAPQRRSIKRRPGAAVLSSLFVGVGLSLFGCTMSDVSDLGSVSMMWLSMKEKSSNGLLSIVRCSKLGKPADTPVELDWVDIEILSSLCASSLRIVFFFRRSAVSSV